MRIPHTELPPATLQAVLEDYVSREGTDYGHQDWSLADKVAAVRLQLDRGEVAISWDPQAESLDLRPVADWPD